MVRVDASPWSQIRKIRTFVVTDKHYREDNFEQSLYIAALNFASCLATSNGQFQTVVLPLSFILYVCSKLILDHYECRSVNIPRLFRKTPMKPIILWQNQRLAYGWLLFNLRLPPSVSFVDGRTKVIIKNIIKSVFTFMVFIFYYIDLDINRS